MIHARRWLRRFAIAAAATAAALIVGVLVVEQVARVNAGSLLGTPAELHGMLMTDAAHRFHPVSGWSGVQTVDGRTTAIRINAHGMRGPEIGAKREGDLRVLVLGDSFVFGHGIAEEETVPARLAAVLSTELGVPVTAGNAGVGGYGTRDLAPSLARQRDFGADAIVACTYVGNDFTDDFRDHYEVVDGFLLDGHLARLAGESFWFRSMLRWRTALLMNKLFEQHVPSLAFDRARMVPPAASPVESLLPLPAQRFADMYMDREPPDALVLHALARCRESYAELARSAAPTPVLLVVIPTWWHIDVEVWRGEIARTGFDPNAFAHGAVQRRVLALGGGGGAGFATLDLTPLLREALFLPHDRHFSPQGAERVAEWIAPHVRNLLHR